MTCVAVSSALPRLVCDFCSSAQNFACGFLQIPPLDGHPCRSANTSYYQACSGLSPPSYCPWRAYNKMTGPCTAAEPGLFHLFDFQRLCLCLQTQLCRLEGMSLGHGVFRAVQAVQDQLAEEGEAVLCTFQFRINLSLTNHMPGRSFAQNRLHTKTPHDCHNSHRAQNAWYRRELSAC